MKGVADMSVSRREFLQYASIVAASTAAAHLMTAPVRADDTAPDPMRHVLNRVTWGARPADRAAIEEMGITGYIDWQLDYENIPDPLVEAFMGARRVLSMDIDEINTAAENDYGVVLNLALWARLYRAVYSERQLYERMVEFWSDHFNIPIPDYLADKIVEDRDVIRRYALNPFREILLASAQNPAMLRYLDNAVSSVEHPNENYARELMELHTLGVDGGYTEEDVVAVARAFTGWTVGSDGRFMFDPDNHDYDAKTILGQAFPAGRGIEEGLQLLDLLAYHPATARYISMKLCRRFVSDDPSQALIDEIAAVFSDTEGDMKAVMRALLTSDEFMASEGQKFRRPLEFLVAALRSVQDGLQIDDPAALVYTLEPMGHLPYFWHPPNGYPYVGVAWMNTNGLLHRWNTALQLGMAGEGFFPGVALNLEAVVPQAATVGELVQTTAERLLYRPLPQSDADELVTLLVGTNAPETPVSASFRQYQMPLLVGMILASPQFQWS